MKIKLVMHCLVVSILFFACKDDKGKKEVINDNLEMQTENKITENENVFSVQLNVQFEKDDALEVFYLENETDTYAASKMIQQKITGMNDFQKINFELPKNIYPTNIRLDFGFNEAQDPIKISDCTISYNNSSFVIKGKDLKNYFNFNGGIEMQSDSLTFKLKPFNLNGKQMHDPYIVGNKNLESALMTKI